MKEISPFKKRKKSAEWERISQKTAFATFKKAATRVPAYKDFLKKHGVDPSDIKSYKDFDRLPVMNKSNYLREYALKDLCMDGVLHKDTHIFSSTSGTTGTPFYFPRSLAIDEQYATLLQDFFELQEIDKDQSTLVLVTFGMGSWIAGTVTYSATIIASERMTTKLSVLTPGIAKDQIFQALKNLAPNYDQTIIIGYPPFVKDILDESKEQNIDIAARNIRCIFAAEVFNEVFREYVTTISEAGDVHLDTMNIYGSADIGAMSAETPGTIALRRYALDHLDVFKDLFQTKTKIPTVTQYNPHVIHFEEVAGEIILTGHNSIPLIRYSIGDQGGVLSFDDVNDILQPYDTSWKDIARGSNISKQLIETPLVYICERSDLSASLYGITISPEIIRTILLRDELQQFITGKFVMSTEYTDTADQYLHIIVECRSDVDHLNTKLIQQVESITYKNLRKQSSEFTELSDKITNKTFIKITHASHNDPDHFEAGRKQQWVKK